MKIYEMQQASLGYEQCGCLYLKSTIKPVSCHASPSSTQVYTCFLVFSIIPLLHARRIVVCFVTCHLYIGALAADATVSDQVFRSA